MLALCLFVAAFLPGCFVSSEEDDATEPYDACPPREVCSPKTPYGLSFTLPVLFDRDETWLNSLPVAVGGTMQIALGLPSSSGSRPLDLPYRAVADGPVTVKGTLGPVVTIAGVQTGQTMLRILDAEDGTLFSKRIVESAEAAKIEVTTDLERGGTAMERPVAFAVGAQRMGVHLLDDKARPLVDSSMKLALDGATQTAWDTLTASVATPGVRTLTASFDIQATRTFEVPFVDHADALELFYEAPMTYGSRGHAELECFYPVSDGYYVVGKSSDWSFSTDTGTLRYFGSDAPGCVDITPTELGMLHLTAQALGASKTLTINVKW